MLCYLSPKVMSFIPSEERETPVLVAGPMSTVLAALHALSCPYDSTLYPFSGLTISRCMGFRTLNSSFMFMSVVNGTRAQLFS